MMTDRSLPEPSATAWQEKPIATRDARTGLQPGLLRFLDRVRQLPYVTAVAAEAFYPGLVVATDVAAVPGEPALLEGWFSAPDEQSATRFRVTTTARSEAEQRAVVHDLRRRLLDR